MSLRQQIKNGSVHLGYTWVVEVKDGKTLHYAEALCAKSGITERIMFHYPAPPEAVAKKFQQAGWRTHVGAGGWVSPLRLRPADKGGASASVITSETNFSKEQATAMGAAMAKALAGEPRAKGGGFTPAPAEPPPPPPSPPAPQPQESEPMQPPQLPLPAAPFGAMQQQEVETHQDPPWKLVFDVLDADPLAAYSAEQVSKLLPQILPGTVNGALRHLEREQYLQRVKMRGADDGRSVWYYSRTTKAPPPMTGYYRNPHIVRPGQRATPALPKGPVTITVLGRAMTMADARELYNALREIFNPGEQ